jgi:pimeloyl-ACP methyl ester carboxylesterase
MTTANADTYVIVHGAFQNAASWTEVAAAIEAEGHTVTVIDLPGRDAEGEAAKAMSLAAYAEAVGAAVSAASEPVTLVGHSFGGITITKVADTMPGQVAKLIYVAAYVPVSGESMQALAEQDTDNGFTAESFVIAADYSFATIFEADRTRLFINDGTPEQQADVASAMIREPLGPIGTPVELTGAFAEVPKAYVKTALDATVSPTLQAMMIDRAGITEVTTLQTGHSPQVSQPAALAEAVLALSAL